MSTQVFPSLPGVTFPVDRTEIWSTIPQVATSGKETRLALWSYPRHRWEFGFDVLRQGTVNGSAYTEFSQLDGFFNSRYGAFDSFLYQDTDDYSVTAQPINVGDGVTTSFQLVRTFGGFVEPILAPWTVSNVYLNGVNQASGWTVSSWGSTTPGVLTFSVAPTAGVSITATFTYYFPVRFVDDEMTFSRFMNLLYSNKKVAIISLKN
jgi:uncharacterized protein (TIGR02217 family)